MFWSQFCSFSSKENYLSPKYMRYKVHELTLRRNVGVYQLYFVTLRDARWYHIYYLLWENILLDLSSVNTFLPLMLKHMGKSGTKLRLLPNSFLSILNDLQT